MPAKEPAPGKKILRQISITVIGRSSGRTISLPVWFVSKENALWLLPVYGSQTQWYRNLLSNPTITIKLGRDSHTLRARSMKDSRTVGKVSQWFREKYTPDMITRLYPGPLDVAVKITLPSDRKA